MNKFKDDADRRQKLLKRLDGHICHHPDCVSWQDDDYCDCAFPDLLEDFQKELDAATDAG